MAAKIKSAKGVDAEIVPGARGAFEISKDGVVVYSKLKVGRFPSNDAEVIDAL